MGCFQHPGFLTHCYIYNNESSPYGANTSEACEIKKVQPFPYPLLELYTHPFKPRYSRTHRTPPQSDFETGFAFCQTICLCWQDFYESGVRLAKWRSQIEALFAALQHSDVISVEWSSRCQCNLEMPTDVSVWENTDCLARAARICQAWKIPNQQPW